MKRSRLLLATCALWLAAATPALADVRTGSVNDQSGPESPYGQPRPDIQQVRVRYDTAGTLRFTARFYQAVPTRSASDGADGFLDTVIRSGTYNGYDCDDFDPADLSLTFYPERNPRKASLYLIGSDKAIPVTQTVSADGREVTVAATRQALAGRGYRCVGPVEHWGNGSDPVEKTDAFKLFGPGAYHRVPPPMPKLTFKATRYYIDQALRYNNLKKPWANRDSGGIGTCQRISKVRVRCNVAWRRKQYDFKGTSTIWYSRYADGETVEWNYAYKITRTDRACVEAGGIDCKQTYQVD